MYYLTFIAALFLFTITLGMIKNKKPWSRVIAFAALTVVAVGASLPSSVMISMTIIAIIIAVLGVLGAYYWDTMNPVDRRKADRTIFGDTLPEDWEKSQ